MSSLTAPTTLEAMSAHVSLAMKEMDTRVKVRKYLISPVENISQLKTNNGSDNVGGSTKYFQCDINSNQVRDTASI